MIAKAEVWAPCQARGIGGLAAIVFRGDLRAVLQKRGIWRWLITTVHGFSEGWSVVCVADGILVAEAGVRPGIS